MTGTGAHKVVLGAAEVPPMFALLAVILVSVVGVSLALTRFRQSLLIGYFGCGVALGNSGVLERLGGQSMKPALTEMADMGVVLLMFTLGLEFSLTELRYLRRAAFGVGSLQVGVSLLAIAGIGMAMGLGWAAALTLGVALAASSTAVGLKTFQDTGLENSSGARLALGIAIFQDLAIIAFAVIMPLLFSAMPGDGVLVPAVAGLVGKSLAFVALAAALARWVIPRLLQTVARSRSNELFTLTVFGLCVGVALIGGLMGLSLALGAFVGGVTVSESIFRHRIHTEVQPLKDLFLTLFFVSVGLLVNLQELAAHWVAVVAVSMGLMLGKAVLIAVLGRKLGWSWRAALLAGAGLASAGEFAFVLMQKAAPYHPWPEVWSQVLTASIALTMTLVPFAVKHSQKLSGWMEKRGWTGKRKGPAPKDARPSTRLKEMHDHAIVCGYGPVGRALVAALDSEGIPSLVVELNADTVRALHKSGRLVLFADATHHETWDLAGVERAQLVAFTFADAPVVSTAIPLVRQHRRDIVVLARVKFASDRARLEALGADIVVNDEAEAGRSIVRNSLAVYERGGS